MKKSLFFLLSLAFLGTATAQILSPADFLGYELGDQFTRHHQVVSYYKALASASENVHLIEYGRTYEDRPLLLAFVSSKSNLENLDAIRLDNLRRAKIEEGTANTDKGIVWLSYNVHGNESVSTEASMRTIHEILTNRQEWLDHMVVVIDPCINPDGRDRYVNFYWQYGNQPFNPDPSSLEHLEPWPRGRANHYLYDLNRDWAWQSQIESKQRMVVYNKWLPQVHVDFHEQGVNSPYYFAPAAEPYHELITKWQRDFQNQIGLNHAKYFDQNDWFYFTKQRFDLLYPSYGDTYPTYNGAIGMTYEQGGSGRAGLGVLKQEGDTLTLKDRIDRHYTTGISTVEVAYNQRTKMLSEFESFFQAGVTNPPGKYKTFVLRTDDQEKMTNIKGWLDKQGIEYGSASGRGLKGYNYQTGKDATFSIGSNDLVISAYQPKSVYAQILLEPQTALSDSLTYDITTWSLPYAYGVEGYASTSKVSVQKGGNDADFEENGSSDKTYAYMARWSHLNDAKFLGELIKKKIKVRFATVPVTYEGERFDRGTIVIAKRDNSQFKNFESIVTAIANDQNQELVAISTGFAQNGPDLGSSDIRYLDAPKVAMVAGDGTNSLSYGATWYFFEQELGYPVSNLPSDDLGYIDLSEYQVLVMPDGGYRSLESGVFETIGEWVRDGGKLILIQGALRSFRDSDYAGLSRYTDDDEKKKFKKIDDQIDEQRRLLDFADRERNYMQGAVPGAVFKVTLDNTHPLAYGYDDQYFSLKTSSSRYGLLESGNVGYIRSSDDHMSGFAGYYVKQFAEKSLVLGVERRGSGQIVYFVDNPLFRSFWHSGKLLVANAIFFVGQ